MRLRLLALLATWWLLLALPAPGAEGQVAPKATGDAGENRTSSGSGQFLVLRGSAEQRREVARRSDSLWTQFIRATGLSARWSHRIVVQLHDRTQTLAPQRRAVGGFRPVEGGGYRFQVDLLQDEEFRWDDYRRELVRLFLFDQVIGANPGAPIRDRIPPWMVTGLHTVLNYRQSGVPNEVFASLLKTRQMMSVGEVLNAVPTLLQDSVSSGVFSACSAALMQALLDQPNGSVRFRALLTDLGTTDTAVEELLRQHFPPLRQNSGELEKWWIAQLTQISKRGGSAVMPLEETERLIEEVLVVRAPEAATPPGAAPEPGSEPPPEDAPANPPLHPDPKKSAPALKLGKFSLFRRPAKPDQQPEPPFEPVHLRFHERYLKEPWAKAVLAEKRAQLAVLQTRAFPLYHPILSGYQEVLASLQEGRVKGLAEHLDRLEQEREAAQALMRGVEDHINWFSTTQIEGMSQDFDGYTQALNLLEKLDQRKRPDPISRYLDAVERELNP